ncbi:protein-L-isoaspartate(D-aspartate) O-methyltransferase [Candidatus Omnitrophota bacterium]
MDFAQARKQMVDQQLVPRGIKDQRVLDAFSKVERHKFVPEELQESAYGDFPIPIGEGQTISQPFIVALMSECLGLSGKEKVLEIGTGSGYQAAILAELAGEVYTVERFAGLSNKAEAVFAGLGITNIKVKVDDGSLGWKDQAPFDRIMVTAASPRVPLPLTEQLKDGGKLVLPLGETFSQVLTVIEKREGKIKSSKVCGCVFVPLVGKYAHPQ